LPPLLSFPTRRSSDLQSLVATRMSTEQMVPILETMDRAGYFALEVWGGATFDSALRYLDEDPWERLRIIRKHVKNTKLQMLLRGDRKSTRLNSSHVSI